MGPWCSATGAKDKMVGAGKEAAGGILGKEGMQNEGQRQQVLFPARPPYSHSPYALALRRQQ